MVEFKSNEDDEVHATDLKDYCLKEFEKLTDQYLKIIKPMNSTVGDLVSKCVDFKLKINDLNDLHNKLVTDNQANLD